MRDDSSGVSPCRCHVRRHRRTNNKTTNSNLQSTPLHIRIQISQSDFTMSRQHTSQKNSRCLSDPCAKEHHTYLRKNHDTVQSLRAQRKPFWTSLPHYPACTCTGTHWFTSNFEERRPFIRYTLQVSFRSLCPGSSRVPQRHP